MLPERFVEIIESVADLAPTARGVELSKHIEAEDDPEVTRLLEHNLRYTMREQSDADFLVYLDKKRRRNRRKTPYTPEEISVLRSEFEA